MRKNLGITGIVVGLWACGDEADNYYYGGGSAENSGDYCEQVMRHMDECDAFYGSNSTDPQYLRKKTEQICRQGLENDKRDERFFECAMRECSSNMVSICEEYQDCDREGGC
mgnify:FL=1